MTRYRSSGVFIFVAALAFLGGNARAAISIVPQPTTLTPGVGTLAIGASDNVGIYRDAESDSTLPWIEKIFKQAKIPTSHVMSAPAAKIVVTMKADAALGAEGYKLSITATQIVITAPTLTGQFYAVQSLRQLFPASIEDSASGVKGPFALPLLEITDKPRFEYRGSMIDPVRKFCPLPYLYQHIDRMALYKLNRLHLLISNDQGYRLESKVYPLLHQLGSTTNCGGQHPAAGERWYYTQDEMRAVVQYASHRKIKIIPEIDMPGHCTAMNFCYKQLGTPNDKIQTSEDVGLSIMNATGPNAAYVNTFIGQLWREMATIFTSDQYQIGGDECVNIAAADFKNFALRVQDTLAAIGKKAIAWDEVGAAGALRASSWSQDWHAGSSAGQIMSSCTYLYLDMANKAGDPSTNNWCIPELTLQGVYGAKFSGTTLRGVEATLFSERVNVYPDYWDRQTWPRQSAVAEIGWAAANNDVNGFLARMAPQSSRYAAMGVKYYNSPGVAWEAGALNPKMTNLYDHFLPAISPDVGIVAKKSKLGNGAAKDGRKSFNTLGRVISPSPMRLPASVEVKKAQ
ncbi:MAG: hypothetical protein JWP91_2121 [Fibrobacteres bacterium]|nr:hypothetical protein [Fibrobacterota bacterium]